MYSLAMVRALPPSPPWFPGIEQDFYELSSNMSVTDISVTGSPTNTSVEYFITMLGPAKIFVPEVVVHDNYGGYIASIAFASALVAAVSCFCRYRMKAAKRRLPRSPQLLHLREAMVQTTPHAPADGEPAILTIAEDSSAQRVVPDLPVWDVANVACHDRAVLQVEAVPPSSDPELRRTALLPYWDVMYADAAHEADAVAEVGNSGGVDREGDDLRHATRDEWV